MEKWTSNYFYGVKIPEQDKQDGFISYATLSSTFNHVLCNEIMTDRWEEAELVNGSDYDEENDSYREVFQWYIIDNYGCEILTRETNEIIYHLDNLDLYVWGVTHWGTAWNGVSTDIELA